MKLYLDNCCFNRPYDDQTLLSIYLETQAKLQIQENIREGKIDLVWSTILDYENSANSDKAIKIEIAGWRNRSKEIIHQNATILEQGRQLSLAHGLGNKDALHISCAIAGNCEYFLTVDKGIIKKRDAIHSIKIRNVIDFIEIWEAYNADGYTNQN